MRHQVTSIALASTTVWVEPLSRPSNAKLPRRTMGSRTSSSSAGSPAGWPSAERQEKSRGSCSGSIGAFSSVNGGRSGRRAR